MPLIGLLSMLTQGGLCVLAGSLSAAESIPRAYAPSVDAAASGSVESSHPASTSCRGFDDAAWHEDRRARQNYESALAGFSIQWADELSPYVLSSTFVLPGREIVIEALQGPPTADYAACAEDGEIAPKGASSWTYASPETPGVYDVRIDDAAGGSSSVLRVFVKAPYTGEEELEGYRLGTYAREPLRNLSKYRMPEGLLRVSDEHHGLYVSPHFQVRQFLCKQQDGPPRYLLLGERLLLQLERLLEEFNLHGVTAKTLTVMSGYRTPWYNRSIGNTTVYSRHLYGDAADVYVDEDGDGRMDDLNEDGRSDRADVEILYEIIEGLEERASWQPFVGGVGLYDAAPHRGPFLHVDTRGYRARW